MKRSFVITRCQVLIGIILIMALLVAVGLLVGFLKKQKCLTVADEQKEMPTTTPLTTTSGPSEDGPWLSPLLPNFASPNHYDLWIYPDFYFGGKTFIGKVDIHINITENTTYLIVNQRKLNISATQVRLEDGDTLEVAREFAYEPHEFWVIEVNRTMTTGSRVILHLEFTGSLVNGLKGFYKTNYTNGLTGMKSWIVSTQFQPIDGRLAFPHFDEPRFKATFTLTMKHWSNFTALSNMPSQENKELEPGWQETTFQKSLPMSSYLLCYVVCDYVYRERTLKSGKTHRIWTSEDKIEQTTYALDIATRMVDFMEEEFGIRYHLPKLDQIAVPQFASGALEHWGLITYHERSLLYDEKTVVPVGKEMIAMIVSHELVHNYFGNLVTCRWWDDLWLNEGFARFFQYKMLEVVHPDWHPVDYFVVRSQQPVMLYDAGAGSRPVVRQVVHPREVGGVFSTPMITYDKGASLLRMIENFMGPKRFFQAAKKLLEDYAFANIDSQDLWDTLQEYISPNLNVSVIMTPWTKQVGLPVVEITIVDDIITARQKRFLDNQKADPNFPQSPYQYIWTIPLEYSTPTKTHLMWLNTSTVDFPDPRASGEWLKFNPGQFGYYRVNYPPPLWHQLADMLLANISALPPVDRAGLLDDALNLARASQLNFSIALTMMRFLAKETHYFPWKTTRKALEYISHMLYGHEHYGLWRKYMRSLTDNALQRLKVQGGGSHLDQMMRTDVIRLACMNGHQECLKNTTELFLKWVENPEKNNIPREIIGEVLLFGMRHAGGEKEFNFLFSRYEKSNSASERINLLKAISATRELWLFKKYLAYCIDQTKIGYKDFYTAIFFAANNQRFNLHLWDWAKSNYDTILESHIIFKTSRLYLNTKLATIASGYKTEHHLKEVENFLKQHKEGPGINNLVLDNIRSNIEWRTKNEAIVIDWLLQNVQ